MVSLHKIALAALLSAAAAAGFAAGGIVVGGAWEDGAEMRWVCQGNQKVQIPFGLKTAEGKVYQGVISCGYET